MAALSSALDSMNISQFGENNSVEYGWSKNVHELITQFQFQLVRNKSNLENLKEQYRNILYNIFISNKKIGHVIDLENAKIVYKLIAYTRDIISGKGEYNLSYMLVSELVKFGEKYKEQVNSKNLNVMACKMLECFVKLNDNEHPLGSWKDLKYFSNYHTNYNSGGFIDRNLLKRDILINKVIELICEQLNVDLKSSNKSLLARWIPREKSHKFGWLTPLIAEKYYSCWFQYDKMTDAQYKAALRKALTHFRQLIAGLNREINTPQINQCSGTWKDIDFEKHVTSITMRKQSKAFNMIDKRGKARNSIIPCSRPDREECKRNYKKYLSDCKNGSKSVKGARVSLTDFVRDAVMLNIYEDENNKDEIDMLNMQWDNNSKQINESLTNVIAMVDTSGSMETDNCLPLYSAIGLGIRAAEKSKLGKRILTFNAKPEWINLEGLSFVDMVKKIKHAGWGQNTNFDAAFDMILNTAISSNISPFEMQDFTLLICSDMQIDQSNRDNSYSMFERMKIKYRDAGLNSRYRTPYTLPHIVFWNLRSTTGFPSLSSTQNTSMLSGNSPALLNMFSENGVSMLKEITPWNMLIKQLNNKRYNHLEDVIDNIWSKQNKKKINVEYMLE